MTAYTWRTWQQGLGGASFALVLLAAATLAPAQSGVATRDQLLMGFHFNQYPRPAPPTELGTELNFDEFTRYLKEDLPYVSMADFWVGWSDIERYKGDERGCANLDRAVSQALAKGMKVKIVLIHSTPWAHDLDWSRPQSMAIGPRNLEDWSHWCALMATHYRGRVAQWDLQGEANGKDYWPFLSPESVAAHVQESYRVGCRAIRRAAPEALVAISCATPGTEGIDIYGERISRQQLDRWYRDNLAACKGLFDAVPINYFSDVTWADPYGGGFAFYKSIRSILDELGLPDVEISSGESSINWADSSYDFEKYGLSVPVQARRLNETLGATFDDGMNKWVFHGIPQPPGFGWVWRWGFRKYEDFWGLWPEANKVPGTRIVWRYDNPGGRKVDYRPAWTRPADPYLPSWEIWKFWAQAMPPRSGARRLLLQVSGCEGKVWRLGSYLANRDEVILLLHHEQKTSMTITADLAKTGWADGTRLAVSGRSDLIGYDTGKRTPVWSQQHIKAQVRNGKVELQMPPNSGWTALQIEPEEAGLAAGLINANLPEQAPAGEPVKARLLLRNTGRASWPKGSRISLELWPKESGVSGGDLKVGPLRATVPAGGIGCFEALLPAADRPQQKGWSLRAVQREGGGSGTYFGPVCEVSCRIIDERRPQKLMAHREAGHIRLKWFAPANSANVQGYEICRCEGIGNQRRLLCSVTDTEYVDSDVRLDQIYEYEAVAVGKNGGRSPASNPDAARALSSPRLWDAEITAHTVPAQLRRGEPRTVSVTVRNTGSKDWDLRPDSGIRVCLQTAQLWDETSESPLPQISLGEPRIISPGQSVTITFPYVGRAEGRFQNHWVMRLEAKGGSGAWFGTPLRVETTVASN